MAKKKNYDSWVYADLKHYKRTEEYNRQLKAILDGCTQELKRLYESDSFKDRYKAQLMDTSFGFSLADFPQQELQAKNYISQMVQSSVKLIEKAQKDSWLAATYKNDDFINSILDTSKLPKEELEKMSDRRLDAFAKFQKRKVNGMGLSERVWKLADGFKDQVELAIDVNIKRGARATKDLEKLVNLPQEMFQAIADIEDEDVRRKVLADVRTGRGVYKSLQANAYRLMRTENNMAYRESDWQRWQNMDFVVGYTIHRTNNADKFKCPLCDELAGDYPKQFKFVGWHPQCMCFVTPIIADDETLKEDQLNRLRSAIRGVSNKVVESKRTVEDVPDNFKKWIKENTYRSARWKSQPYFIRDNFANGNLAEGLAGMKSGISAEADFISSPYFQKPITQSEMEQDVPLPQQFKEYIDKHPIEVKEVSTLEKSLNDEQIISKIAGGDKTGGSCVSQSLAYAGVRCGLDVEDYRGGKSQKAFSENAYKLLPSLGGEVVKTYTPHQEMLDLLKELPTKTEAILVGCSHASVVRKIEIVDNNGKTKIIMQYLELQSPTNNGWKELNSKTMRSRFVTVTKTSSAWSVGIVKITEIRKHPALLRKLLGLVNTAKDKQKKGDDGSIK